MPESQEKYGAKIGDIVATYAAQFITGKLDIDEGWDEYLAAMDEAGYQEVKKDYNEYLKNK